MSLPEIIPSNLPQFVQNKARSAFENSVIPSSCVLLFAESDGNGGSKLIAKNPDGSFTEVGGGGGTGTFYKCSAVDTANSEWSGNLASVDPVTGVWSFASTATTGLEYDRITPVVGSVYDEDCTFEVKNYPAPIPTQGLVYHHTCDSLLAMDVFNNTFTYNQGNISIEADAELGKNIMNLQAGTVKTVFSTDYAQSDFTISTWMKQSLSDAIDYTICFLEDQADYYRCALQRFAVCMNYDRKHDILANPDITKWNHYAFVKEGTTMSLYINGTLINSVTMSSYPNWNVKTLVLGSNNADNTSKDGTAKFGDIRMYNRALDSSEIVGLATEFSPTPAS